MNEMEHVMFNWRVRELQCILHKRQQMYKDMWKVIVVFVFCDVLAVFCRLPFIMIVLLCLFLVVFAIWQLFQWVKIAGTKKTLADMEANPLECLE